MTYALHYQPPWRHNKPCPSIRTEITPSVGYTILDLSLQVFTRDG